MQVITAVIGLVGVALLAYYFVSLMRGDRQ